MISIRYTGGLGNQMFEYAMNVILKYKFPEEKIYADLTRYDLTNEHDGFDIVKYFNIEIIPIKAVDLKKIAPIVYWCKRWNMKRLLPYLPIGKVEQINEKFEKKNKRIGIISDYAPTNYNKDACFLNYEKRDIWHYKGNWINPKYWEGYESQIQKSFIFKEEILSKEDRILMEEMKNGESVAIHIRKGDYTGNYLYDICGNDYYCNAIKKLYSITKQRKIKIYIFSETPNLKIEFLPGIEYKTVSHANQPGIDMWLMSKCRYNIIANSTFSFWAAFLNNYRNKIVIAPMYIYRGDVYVKFPMPQEWIPINNFENIQTLCMEED